MSSEVSAESVSIAFHDAFKAWWRKLGQSIPQGGDPAPWFDPPAFYADGDPSRNPASYTHEAKTHELAKFSLLASLLRGEQSALFRDGQATCRVPGWAWVGAEAEVSVWAFGRLPLDVLLPDEWQRWSCHSVYLDSGTFTEWMDSQPLHVTADRPALPAPYDAQSKPEAVKRRLPPDAPFVTLSEALTWIAFGVALDRDSLDRALSGNVFHAVDPQAALSAAMAKLALRASGGQIPMRGKYVESHSTDENKVLTEPIDPVRFADFAQFDILYDGLRYGTGLTLNGPGSALERAMQDRRDAYRSVSVERDSLLQCFPPAEAIAGVPLAVTVGELTLPGEDFDLNTEVIVSPWWSLLQAVGWIATRSKAYIGYVAELEGAAYDDIGTSVAFSAVVTYVARKHCRCAAHIHPDDARWEYCSCTGDAGRSLLEAIRTDQAKVIQRTSQGPKQLAFHDLAGVGQRPTCVDWLNNNLALQFSSAEVIAAFPAGTPQVERPALASAQVALRPTIKTELPPLPEKALATWWGKLSPADRHESLIKLWQMAKSAHPTHTITRQRIRALAPGRKRGPKPLSQKITA